MPVVIYRISNGSRRPARTHGDICANGIRKRPRIRHVMWKPLSLQWIYAILGFRPNCLIFADAWLLGIMGGRSIRVHDAVYAFRRNIHKALYKRRAVIYKFRCATHIFDALQTHLKHSERGGVRTRGLKTMAPKSYQLVR